MNRRDLLKALPGLPAISALPSLDKVVRLDASNVSTGMRVDGDEAGTTFDMTLFRKPWPKVGDVIEVTCGDLVLRGTVTSWTSEATRGKDRCYYHIRGNVLAFDARGVIG